jgi:biopolymer transport protein ExbD
LIDIVFLLLIFFMLTSRFVAHEGIKVDLPTTERSHTLPASEGSVIILKGDGTVFFGGRIYSLMNLQRLLIQRRVSVLDRPIEIQSDRGASVQSMVSLLELLRTLGAKKVTIVTIQEPLSAPP